MLNFDKRWQQEQAKSLKWWIGKDSPAVRHHLTFRRPCNVLTSIVMLEVHFDFLSTYMYYVLGDHICSLAVQTTAVTFIPSFLAPSTLRYERSTRCTKSLFWHVRGVSKSVLLRLIRDPLGTVVDAKVEYPPLISSD